MSRYALEKRCAVSRDMIGAVEAGRSVPPLHLGREARLEPRFQALRTGPDARARALRCAGQTLRLRAGIRCHYSFGIRASIALLVTGIRHWPFV
jgi:hypothetical protein